MGRRGAGWVLLLGLVAGVLLGRLLQHLHVRLDVVGPQRIQTRVLRAVVTPPVLLRHPVVEPLHLRDTPTKPLLGLVLV